MKNKTLLGIVSGFAAAALLGVALGCLIAFFATGAVPFRTPVDVPEPAPAEAAPARVVISEVMPSNHATLADRAGSFGDWVELQNTGAEAADLEGFRLRCGKDSWTLPALTLAPSEYLLIFCDEADSTENGELHSSFAVSASGEMLRLYDREDRKLDEFRTGEAARDESFCRDAGGAVISCRWPTPGFENSEAGCEAFRRTRVFGSDSLMLSEVLVSGGDAGSGGDWIEFFNPTDRVLNLGDYYLSDRGSERTRFRLPQRELLPGACAVLRCGAPQTSASQQIPFGLNAECEELFLSRADGSLCDYLLLREVPRDCSFGRSADEGLLYYERPTPGRGNGAGARFPGEKPVLIGRDGVFAPDEDVIVELSGRGTVRYTLDGSEPTAFSAEYTGPLRVVATCVIRAASFQENHCRSDVLSLSYILNDGHRLPVVSLVCDPDGMFSETGIYSRPTEDLEIPAALMLYGPADECLRIDCGVKLHGATSRVEQVKKSLKLTFRNRYGGVLHHDLFGNGVEDYASVLLRSAQEGRSSSYMRDALMHELALRCFPELPAQDHRYVALYINARYWGLYNLREAHSEEHFAAHFDADAQSVRQWRGQWPQDSLFEEIYQFALNHDLSDPENYAHVAAHLNIESVIGWLILQDYSGNFDYNSPNMRFYWSEEQQTLHYALVDLDLGLFTEGNLPLLTDHGYYAYNKLAGALMQNPDFRKAFCTRLNAVLSGPMSDESVLHLIDRFAAEIRPEIPAEKNRWGGKVADWEHLVRDIRGYITKRDGAAENMVRLMVANGALKSAEAKQYLPDFIR